MNRRYFPPAVADMARKGTQGMFDGHTWEPPAPKVSMDDVFNPTLNPNRGNTPDPTLISRPTSQATGLPMGVEQLAREGPEYLRGTTLAPGVESKGKALFSPDLGPQQPRVHNGGLVNAPAAIPAMNPAAAKLFGFNVPQDPPPPVMDEGQRLASRITGGAPAPFAGPNSLSRGAQPRGLGGAAPVPVGRSRYDADRMAEQMVRRRDPRGAQFLFGQARDAQDRAFSREMFGAQEGAAIAREQRGEAREDLRFGRELEAEKQREQRRARRENFLFGREQQVEEQRYQRRRQDELTDEQRRNGFTTRPLDPNDPTKGTAVVRGDGSLFNILPYEAPQAPLPPGLVPQGAMRDGVQYGPAEAPRPEVTWQEDPGTGQRVPYQQMIDPQTGEITFKRLRVQGSPQDTGAGGAAPAAMNGSTQTAAGTKFRLKP